MTALATAYDHGLKLSQAGRHAEAIEQYERALTVEPNSPRVLFALGNTARALGMPGPAEQMFRQVLAIEPGRLEAVVSLANLLRAGGQFDAAKALLEPALARQPEAPELWLTLGSTLREMGDWMPAEVHYREALRLKPDYAAAAANLADMLTDAGAIDEARSLYDKAVRLAPNDAQAKLNRAVLHLLTGNLKDGWRDYAARLKLAKAPIREHRIAAWSGGPLKRTRLLVGGEQGIGDQIMFASMIPELCARAADEGGSVVLECEPRLVTLFARSFPQATVHGWDLVEREGVKRARYDWLKAAGGANAFVEMGSLGKVLRREIADFPKRHAYLKPQAIEMAQFGGAFAGVGDGPFIGVCWRSGNTAGHRALQYAPLGAWAQFIAKLPGTVVSVQYDATEAEVDILSALAERPILTLDGLDQKNELDRSCAMLASLDAVVTAPTAVAWLAAGAGVETYKIVYDTSWTAFAQTYEPFAPSCAVVMPDTRGDWASAFGKVLTRLSS
ncbi:MAG: tetratricopeptide repeat protein [Alphaproteobacteria bacterium]|nr:tetratricopeptide repeat protein [Alphaproteobacteria bacterium]